MIFVELPSHITGRLLRAAAAARGCGLTLMLAVTGSPIQPVGPGPIGAPINVTVTGAFVELSNEPDI